MQKIMLSFAVLFLALGSVDAQKYFTRSGKISFYSDAPMEKIEAVNNSATSVIDIEAGKMEFAVLIKGFQFDKSLMQEHFNENYMESGKCPKAIFKGQLADPSKVDFRSAGTYTATVSGELTIHGVTKPLETEATFVVKDNAFTGTSQFSIAVADYKIEIPAVVRDNVAKTVLVAVDMSYEPFNK